MVVAHIPLHPANPERICWGCDKYCPADDLACGNGTIRTLHPVELLGEDWVEWVEQKDRNHGSNHGSLKRDTGPLRGLHG